MILCSRMDPESQFLQHADNLTLEANELIVLREQIERTVVVYEIAVLDHILPRRTPLKLKVIEGIFQTIMDDFYVEFLISSIFIAPEPS